MLYNVNMFTAFLNYNVLRWFLIFLILLFLGYYFYPDSAEKKDISISKSKVDENVKYDFETEEEYRDLVVKLHLGELDVNKLTDEFYLTEEFFEKWDRDSEYFPMYDNVGEAMFLNFRRFKKRAYESGVGRYDIARWIEDECDEKKCIWYFQYSLKGFQDVEEAKFAFYKKRGKGNEHIFTEDKGLLIVGIDYSYGRSIDFLPRGDARFGDRSYLLSSYKRHCINGGYKDCYDRYNNW